MPTSKAVILIPLFFAAQCLMGVHRLHAAGGAGGLAHYVNAFIGTAPTPHGHFGRFGNAGDVFPGADTPFGMVQFSPDTGRTGKSWTIPGGYFYPDTRISGFSLDHYSGRGCDYMEDFGFLPINKPVVPSTDPGLITAGFHHSGERASPGYYRVILNDGTRVQLTVTPRSGMACFTFPRSVSQATILINVTHSVRGALAGGVKFVNPHEISGWVKTRVGCGAPTYHAYFDAIFNRSPAATGVWKRSHVISGGVLSGGRDAGAYVTFENTAHESLLMKVGLSYVSAANARLNRRTENPGWHFNAVRRAAKQVWNRALGHIEVHGGSVDEKTIFYTALYHCMFEPSLFDDVNGQYIGFDDKIHQLPRGHNQYDNISGWDFYRSQAPLLGFLFPRIASDVAQSLINDTAQDKGGGIPRWEQTNRNSNGMVGDGNLPLIANIYAFGGRDFDTHAGLRAMERNALVRGTTSDGYKVRNHLSGYLRRGWVAQKHNRAAAGTLEYATADFATAQFAAALGNNHTAALLERHAANWRNLFNPKTRYLQPRQADGRWPPVKPQDITGWAEGSTAQYTWIVPFDFPGLITRMGGPAVVVKRLGTFFTRLNAGPHSIYYFNGNEPGESTPWIYDFLDRPWKTQQVVRRIELTLWTDLPSGLPGNDDGGAMSSWYVFSAMGLYPEVPAVGGFVPGSPIFRRMTIHFGHGRTLLIRGLHAGPGRPYVQSMTFDGKAMEHLWLPLTALKMRRRASLRFVLSSHPNRRWGSSPADAPPRFMPGPGKAAPMK